MSALPSRTPTPRPPKKATALADVHLKLDQAMADLEDRIKTDPGSLTLNEWVAIISVFDRRRFGHVPIAGTMLKLYQEVGEVCEAPKDGAEYSDVLILLTSIAGRSGLRDLATPLAAKLLEIWDQEFKMQPNGTGRRVKGPPNGQASS